MLGPARSDAAHSSNSTARSQPTLREEEPIDFEQLCSHCERNLFFPELAKAKEIGHIYRAAANLLYTMINSISEPDLMSWDAKHGASPDSELVQNTERFLVLLGAAYDLRRIADGQEPSRERVPAELSEFRRLYAEEIRIMSGREKSSINEGLDPLPEVSVLSRDELYQRRFFYTHRQLEEALQLDPKAASELEEKLVLGLLRNYEASPSMSSSREAVNQILQDIWAEHIGWFGSSQGERTTQREA